jgi:hypothetical protein
MRSIVTAPDALIWSRPSAMTVEPTGADPRTRDPVTTISLLASAFSGSTWTGPAVSASVVAGGVAGAVAGCAIALLEKAIIAAKVITDAPAFQGRTEPISPLHGRRDRHARCGSPGWRLATEALLHPPIVVVHNNFDDTSRNMVEKVNYLFADG